ncbi:MAG: hypothetical protein AB7L13_08100 [Acidimicrobiia bacterium]
MNILAVLVLAPILAWFVSSRKAVYGVVAGVFFLTLPPIVHGVLLDDQLDERSLGNTISFFFVNYVGLAIALGIAALVMRRRHPSPSTTGVMTAPITR